MTIAAVIGRWWTRRRPEGGWGLGLVAEDTTPLEPDEVLVEDPAPTLREELLARDRFVEWPPSHVCLPDCPDRPTVYMGPVILGPRCQICLGPDGPECGACFVREDARAVRRADR